MGDLPNLLSSGLWCFTLKAGYARNIHQLVIWDLLMTNDLLKQFCNSFEFCVLSIGNAGSSYHPNSVQQIACVWQVKGESYFLLYGTKMQNLRYGYCCKFCIQSAFIWQNELLMSALRNKVTVKKATKYFLSLLLFVLLSPIFLP